MIEAFKDVLARHVQERKDGRRITEQDLSDIARQIKELIERDEKRTNKEQND
jgi:hypothetical protein